MSASSPPEYQWVRSVGFALGALAAFVNDGDPGRTCKEFQIIGGVQKLTRTESILLITLHDNIIYNDRSRILCTECNLELLKSSAATRSHRDPQYGCRGNLILSERFPGDICTRSGTDSDATCAESLAAEFAAPSHC